MANEFNQDHYTLFGLPRRYAIDLAVLEQVYRDVLSRVHPDKHVSLSDAEQRQAMQWATHANEAYQTLRDPLRRARYQLQLVGMDVQLEQNTAMPSDFLIRQMELREAAEEARSAADLEALEEMHRRIKLEIAEQYQRLANQLDLSADYAAACATVRQMMFQEKLLQEIDDALSMLEA